MKKKIVIVLIMSIFIFCKNVQANNLNRIFEVNKNNMYYILNIKKELNGQSVTMEFESNRRNDGVEGYSLEPFKEIETNDKYQFTTTGIPEKLGITEELWKDVELIMYYGYQYENHKTRPWLALTQLLVWRTLYPEGVFEFTTTESEDNYQTEMDEVLSLVENHKKGPDFGEEEFSLKVGEQKILTDSTNKLEEYSISNSDGLNVSRTSNTITIEGTKSGMQELKLTKSFPIKKHEKTALYYDDKGSQMIAVVNDLPDFTKTIKIMVNVGNVTLDIKNANTTYSNCSSEDKTIYGLYDGEDLLETFDASSTKTFTSKDLPAKTYQVKQISHACSDKEDKTIYDATISLEEPNAHVNINVLENTKEVKIIKKYGDKLEENAKFSLGDTHKSFSLTTNPSGEASITLGYGTYTLKQISGIKNYSLIKDQTITINDETPDVLPIELTSEPLVGSFTLNIVRNEDYYSNCSSSYKTLYGLYESDTNNLVESFLGNATKSYTLNNLPLKKYYVKQISYACSDKKDEKTYEVNLTTKKNNITLDLDVYENFVELTINKKYYNNDTGKLTLERDAVFEVSDEENTFTLTTNSKGNAKIKLGYGTYTIKQISGKENFALVNDQTITIDKNTPSEYLLEFQSNEIVKNITVLVADEEGNPIKGAVIALYKGTRKQEELTTDDKGIVCFTSLSLREYIIKELSLPEDIALDYQTKTINLLEDSTITLTNKRIKVLENIPEEEKQDITEELNTIEDLPPIPNTKAEGDGIIIKFYTLLFTLIFYTFYVKKV